jgi:hypothetical protein
VSFNQLRWVYASSTALNAVMFVLCDQFASLVLALVFASLAIAAAGLVRPGRWP